VLPAIAGKTASTQVRYRTSIMAPTGHEFAAAYAHKLVT
jgi:hypothetical protein